MKSLFLCILLCFTFSSFSQLTEVTDKLPVNPGKLNTYIHIPKNKWSKGLPLVVVLHGCSQKAKDIYTDAGWEKLSDSLGFIVLLPEQRIRNNSGRCFRWFIEENQQESGKEIHSIEEAIYWCREQFETDTTRTYIYGVSAGAAMAVNCVFLHPELYNGAAILAGASFGVASNYKETFNSVFKAKLLPDSVLVQDTPEQVIKSLSFPKTIVFQGDNDKIVAPEHAYNLVRQIQIARKLSVTEPGPLRTSNPKFPIRETAYTDSSGIIRMSLLLVHDWGHYLMVDPGNSPEQGGALSITSKDGDFWSTAYIVNFWELTTK